MLLTTATQFQSIFTSTLSIHPSVNLSLYLLFQSINPLIAKKMQDDRGRDYTNARRVAKEYETVTKGLSRNAPSVPPQNNPEEVKQVGTTSTDSKTKGLYDWRHVPTIMFPKSCSHNHIHTIMFTQSCSHIHVHTIMFTQSCSHNHFMFPQSCSHNHVE